MNHLVDEYRRIRALSEALAEPLTPEDCTTQSMPDTSPVKWHLAHTTWFFETFILEQAVSNYRAFHPQFGYLFNSYYEAVGERHPRPERGLLSRPTLAETLSYRRAVDEAMVTFIERQPAPELEALIVLGLNHEQQHQELILTDVKHLLSRNPLRPAYREEPLEEARAVALRWERFEGGICDIGHVGDGFAFDNEQPRHPELLQPYLLANRLVTNGEYLAFMEDGGYRRPEYWLSAGWAAVQERDWDAPLYWERPDGEWWHFTLLGMRPVDPNHSACHLSYFEADAYARWAGARLPTESEWEVAAASSWRADERPGPDLHPPTTAGDNTLAQLQGAVWQWTRSAYLPYPGFRTAPGAVGEYNGKFMCGQFVLRGGSCATPPGHSRVTYRNFFPPDARWQFTGLRLARDLDAPSRN